MRVDPTSLRPNKVELLFDNPTKFNTQRGWKPEYDLAGLVEDMMKGDLSANLSHS